MSDDSKSIVEKMLDFVYTGDYTEFFCQPTNNQPPSISALKLHARLFALADRYSISALCDVAADKYMSRFKHHFDPLEYLQSIPDIYFSTTLCNRKLREYILKFSRDNLQSLLHERPIREKYNSVAAQVPSLVKNMLDTYIDAPVLGSCLNCGNRKPMLPLQVRCQEWNRGTDLSHQNHAIEYMYHGVRMD